LKAIEKRSRTDEVVDSIKNSIIKNEFKMGAKLPSEDALCETLGVSRSTIREAFRVLQTMGYVELKPGRGAFVQDTNPRDIASIYRWFKKSAPKLEDFTEVRGVLETLAIKMAIERSNDAEIAALKKINTAFHKAVKAGNTLEVSELDESFHEQIFSMTKNSLLINVNKLVAVEFRKYRLMSFSLAKNCQSAVTPHDKIMDAICRRDETDGIKQMENHLKQVIIDMEKMVAQA
jgi:GntR family transcriptional repressor for pyruvate dehydrogenase complex